eukprot:3940406-Rhodomonas_salina.2
MSVPDSVYQARSTIPLAQYYTRRRRYLSFASTSSSRDNVPFRHSELVTPFAVVIVADVGSILESSAGTIHTEMSDKKSCVFSAVGTRNAVFNRWSSHSTGHLVVRT